MWVLLRLFKLWPRVDTDSFYPKVKFGHIGFYMGKSENYFFGNYCSLRSQSCLKNSTKWVYEVEWVSKVKAILWPWSKVTQISKLKLVSRRNSWAIWNQSSYESLRESRLWCRKSPYRVSSRLGCAMRRLENSLCQPSRKSCVVRRQQLL